MRVVGTRGTWVGFHRMQVPVLASRSRACPPSEVGGVDCVDQDWLRYQCELLVVQLSYLTEVK